MEEWNFVVFSHWPTITEPGGKGKRSRHRPAEHNVIGKSEAHSLAAVKSPTVPADPFVPPFARRISHALPRFVW